MREELRQKNQTVSSDADAAKLPTRRDFIGTTNLALALGVISAITSACSRPQLRKPSSTETLEVPEVIPVCPDIFSGLKAIPMDNYTDMVKETCRDINLRSTTMTRLADGSEIASNELGISTYKVRAGDTVEKIINKLAATSEFSYLKSHPAITFDEVGNVNKLSKLRSFNILNKNLLVDTWIPIPVPEEFRKIPDANFMNYSFHALAQICRSPHYGDKAKALIQEVGTRELLCTIFAIAKQESGLGGHAIGSCELHRFEPHHRAFSYSHFHVLNADDGKAALNNLQLTGTRCYHPINGAQLCVAFLVEKSGGGAQKFFPLGEKLESFASFYNGGNWRKTNPHYIENISKYYEEAKALLATANTNLPAAGSDLTIEQFGSKLDFTKVTEDAPAPNKVGVSTDPKESQSGPQPYLVKKGDDIKQVVDRSIKLVADSPALSTEVRDHLTASITSQLTQVFGKPYVYPGDQLQIVPLPKSFFSFTQKWQAVLIRKGQEQQFII